MKKISQLILGALFLFLLAGCNGGGGNLSKGGDTFSTQSLGSDTFSAPQSFAASPSSDGSGTTDNGGTTDSGIQIATVHNPEPTTMLLWSIGLLGLARSRRRKR